MINGKFTSSEAAKYPARMNKLLAQAIARADKAHPTTSTAAQEPGEGRGVVDGTLDEDIYIDQYGKEYQAYIVDPDLLF